METKQSAVDWLYQQLTYTWNDSESVMELLKQAKQMEREQMGYTKEDVLKAGEMGEINHHDYKHIVSLIDEARELNRNKR